MKKDSKPSKSSKGGPSNMDRKKYGRNMSRVMNQRGGKRGS
jgi:hypothetical protein